MQTAVIFVDAGYLFSAGSDLLFGRVVPRKQIDLRKPEGIVRNLMTATEALWDGEALRLLRTYWYDGAVDGVPSATQVAVGELPRVKLRLGRISAGGQKGVDGLIILDLITLARNRAADVAIILSGDEDLRETALHAQSFGVTVVVAGFPPTAKQRQSALLLREADHVVHLGDAAVVEHLCLVEAVPAAPVGLGSDESSVALPQDAVLSAPASEEADESLDALCRGVATDARFAKTGIVEHTATGKRLTRQADRVLIARLAELTGVFPVEAAVVRRARSRCIQIAAGSPAANPGVASGQPE